MANAIPNPITTMFFDVGNFGWSESHVYYNDVPILDVGFQAEVARLMALRVDMLAYGVILRYCRSSKGATWRDSTFTPVPQIRTGTGGNIPLGVPFQGFTAASGTFGPADDPSDCSTWRLETGSEHRGIEYISGFPAAAQTQPNTYPWNNGPFSWLKTASDKYFQYLAGMTTQNLRDGPASKWGTIVRLKAQENGAGAVVTNFSVTSPAQGTFTFTTAAEPEWKAGDPIRILGVRNNPAGPKARANGTWNVSSRSAAAPWVTTVITSAKNIPDVSLFIANTGTAQLIKTAFQAYNFASYDGQTHHKRGRPFGSPRGRSKRPGVAAVV